MKIGVRVLAVALMAVSAMAFAEVRRSITTKFVEVLVEGVPLGSRYVLESKPVEMFNGSELSLKLRFDAEVPGPSEMRAGYEPIPDPAWISFEPRSFSVETGRTATGKLVLYVPDDPALVGKRFQAMLYLHTDSTEPGMVGMGLRPRFLFSIAKKESKDTPGVVNNPAPKARLTPFGTSPTESYMTFSCSPLKAENLFREEMLYEIALDPGAADRVGMAKGETLVTDPSWLEVSPPDIVLHANTRAEVSVTMKIPLKAENFGKTFVAALRSKAHRKGEVVEVFNKVRIVVPDFPSMGRTVTGAPKAK
jgi:hypothetical protein